MIQMRKHQRIKSPFFEIGPKNYMFGDRILELALAADVASKKYDVDIIFTAPFVDIRTVSERTENIHVIAPHMDCIPIGRGLADILPEALKAAGAEGVMLNHSEKPLDHYTLADTIKRAKQLGLITIVCADSVAEINSIALMNPDIIIAEPSELIGTGKGGDLDYVRESCNAVKAINPEILVLVAAGIKNGKDVYDVIFAGADASGSSSGITEAPDPILMIDEMVGAVRQAWNDKTSERAEAL